MKQKDPELIKRGIEVSPISYLGTTDFVIGLLVEKGHLKVRRDANGRPHFMKADMDEFLGRVRKRSAALAQDKLQTCLEG